MQWVAQKTIQSEPRTARFVASHPYRSGFGRLFSLFIRERILNTNAPVPTKPAGSAVNLLQVIDRASGEVNG
jgi:hypothetical protein